MKPYNLNIEIKVIEYIKTNKVLKNYPNISNQEMELLSWNISGEICISYGEIILTKNLNSESNYITEYLWHFLTQLHIQIPKLLKGEKVTQDFFDNPETLSFIPNSKIITIIFECGCENHKSYQKIKVPIEEVFSALLKSTRKLIDELLLINPKLENTIEVKTLIEAYDCTKSLFNNQVCV